MKPAPPVIRICMSPVDASYGYALASAPRDEVVSSKAGSITYGWDVPCASGHKRIKRHDSVLSEADVASREPRARAGGSHAPAHSARDRARRTRRRPGGVGA